MNPLAINIGQNLVTLCIIIYVGFLIYTYIRILLDTHSTAKTLGYLLVVTLIPVLGIVLYYALGKNYRHLKRNKQGEASLDSFTNDYKKGVSDETNALVKAHKKALKKYVELVHFIYNLGGEKLSRNNYKLLINGEEKFPEVLASLKKATHFIHMEYYDWENDTRGNQIKDVLLDRRKQGVTVRIMFDDFASHGIKGNIVKELKKAGVEMYPVIKVKLVEFANRLNHRDHRKIIIIDGIVGFVGGVNISDRYDNSIDTGLYWRDTHVKIMGTTVHNLNRHFIVNWNVCQPNKLEFSHDLFPEIPEETLDPDLELAQVVAGGPIYPMSNIMLAYFKIFTLASKKLYITNPYFIPNDSILNALKESAISGVDVRLMVPETSDSAVVGAASMFYFEELLQAGVRVFLYKKGFVHAKTVVADSYLSVVGTANMDIRSFELNFEEMSVIYGPKFAEKLEQQYIKDLEECRELNYAEWVNQSVFKKLIYSIARLISSVL